MAVAAEVSIKNYQFVDDIPALAAARQEVRAEAEATMEARRLGIEANGPEDFLLPIDALSTAKQAHQAANVYGEHSPEHLDRLEGLELDCQRLVAEWWRKLRPEWFPVTVHKYDPGTQSFFSHGMSVRQMTHNALTPMPDDPEEEARRVNERVEDETPSIVRSLGGAALRGARIRTISECTDKAIEDYQDDQRSGAKHRGYRGYAPEVEKIAIRDLWIDQETGDRFEEVVLLPGEYLDHRTIQIALSELGLAAENLDKTRLHGAQILAFDSLMNFVKRLNKVAGEQWAANVFMGEKVAEDHAKDYSAFQREALDRQAGQKDLARTVANYIWDLAADEGVDPRTAPAKVEKFVKMLLLNHGKKDIRAVEDMFDKKTAAGLREVVRLEATDRYQEAQAKMQEVEESAPGGGYCGGGSCGIERLNEFSKRGKKAKEALEAESGETLVEDKERRCKSCRNKGAIYYAYSSTKVKKYCDSCGAKEFKKTPFRS